MRAAVEGRLPRGIGVERLARCPSRMEPAVRSPRIESAIIADRVRNVAFGLPSSQNSRGRPASGRRKPCRGERNFWMQRREAKNRPERPQVSPETERAQRYLRKSPQKRPIWSGRRDLRFRRTGWWRPSGPNWLLPTQSSKPVSETRVRNGIFCCRDRATKQAHSARLQEQRPRHQDNLAGMSLRLRRNCECLGDCATTECGWWARQGSNL